MRCCKLVSVVSSRPCCCFDFCASQLTSVSCSTALSTLPHAQHRSPCGHCLCGIQQQVGHVPVATTAQGQHVALLFWDEVLVVEVDPLPITLLHPGHVVPRVCAATLVREHRHQVVPPCTQGATSEQRSASWGACAAQAGLCVRCVTWQSPDLSGLCLRLDCSRAERAGKSGTRAAARCSQRSGMYVSSPVSWPTWLLATSGWASVMGMSSGGAAAACAACAAAPLLSTAALVGAAELAAGATAVVTAPAAAEEASFFSACAAHNSSGPAACLVAASCSLLLMLSSKLAAL